MTRRIAALVLALLAMQARAANQGFFLPAGDARLRDDLTLLVDQGIINLPVNEWPLPRADVAQAIAGVKDEDLQDPALRAVLARVRAASAQPQDAAAWKIREVRAAAGQPALLRDFGTPARENGELTSIGGASTDRYSITVAATGVVDPSDGQHLRFDGSDISIRWGNWLLGLGETDRWWGPGHDGSLILSTNARPMPSISLDRVRSLPFDIPVLRWLGPWRFTWFFGLGEQHRADTDQPLFMGMRLSFKPASWLEFAASRSAQFCGKGRECNIDTFGRMLIGQDNRGIRGLSSNPAKEPGNQMAGFEARVVSPFKPLPYLGLFGGELWFALESGSVLRAHVEYANTKVKWYNGEDEFNVAYRQAIFFAGYRYRGRNIGDTTDADSETTSLGMSLTSREGDRWSLLYRHGALDRDGSVDPYNTITAGRSQYKSMQLDWDGRLSADNGLALQLGYERQSPSSAGNARGLFGFIQWRRQLR